MLVCVSHEGETTLTLEAARALGRDAGWSRARRTPRSRRRATRSSSHARDRGELLPHRELHGCRRGAAALLGEDVSWLPGARRGGARRPPLPVSDHERWLVAGAGRDWPTAQEAVLKLREGAHVAAEAHQTEQLLHGYLAAVDESVRAFVLEGEGRAAERAACGRRRARELGCDATLVPTRHPAVDIVPFQLLTVDLAERRGVDPDRIRRHDDRWAAAAAAREPPSGDASAPSADLTDVCLDTAVLRADRRIPVRERRELLCACFEHEPA